MLFVDFFISKSFTQKLSTPHINNALAIIEIETSCPARNDIVDFMTSVDNAVFQLEEYCDRLSEGAFAHTKQAGFIPGYLVFGDFYTQVKKVDGILEIELWKHVFEEMALEDNTFHSSTNSSWNPGIPEDSGQNLEVLLVPPLFLSDSGHSSRIWWNPVD